ncbi:hypothetical protein QO207_04575 [Pseudomonas sp. CAN2814]|uniref:hypothetical protein n=1 Tax=Pseudomonas sp. CAN1 TaxID=3046726 RepID=UPI00264998D4|nr:hypothetical protein [Pseudomonas sp. CAN1]MDN6855857.1 hypothetical protein [Pseudomonas sp. CAN1]
MSLKKFEDGIKKTGFEFEFRVTNLLRESGWNIISNRYYVDDIEGTVREIDILAYKRSKLEDFSVYTALVISCKKSEDRAWALLARDLNERDPNTDWFPYHGYSSHKGVGYQTAQASWPEIYSTRVTELGNDLSDLPSAEIFAFQEMQLSNGSPQNDKAIFSSINSLMKAQAYELRSVAKRERKNVVYQFNLISALSGKLIKLHFSDENEPKANELSSEIYLSKYILNGEQTSTRIRFVTEAALEEKISSYSKLHETNCTIFGEQCDEFYKDALRNSGKRKLLLSDFKAEFLPKINKFLFANRRKRISSDDIDAWATNDSALIEVSEDDDIVEFLNGDKEALKIGSDSLRKIYKYKGEFSFSSIIPF